MKTIINIFETNIDCLTKENFLRELKLAKSALRVVKINSEFLLRAHKDKEFNKVLNNADLRVADGVGVLWAAKYLTLPLVNILVLKQIQAVWQMIYSGASLVFYPRYCRYPIPEAFRGVEMMYMMLDFAEKEKLPVYLFGAGADVLEKAVKEVGRKYPNLEIAGSNSGYDFNNQEVIEDINKSGAKIIFVALSSPIQEYWMRDNLSKVSDAEIAVGEGGSFEFIAGSFKRSPVWMRSIGVEWLWRLFANKSLTPAVGSRLKRVWNAVPVFISEVIKYKLRKD